MVKTFLLIEAAAIQRQRSNNSLAFLRGVVVRYRKAEIHTNAPQGHNTLYRPRRSRCARVKRQLLGKWPRGLPRLRKLLMFCCACVRAGANLRPYLQTTSGEEIPFSLRSGRHRPFRWISNIIGNCQKQHSSPHTCSVHRSYCCCRRTLCQYHKSISYGLHRGTANSGLTASILFVLSIDFSTVVRKTLRLYAPCSKCPPLWDEPAQTTQNDGNAGFAEKCQINNKKTSTRTPTLIRSLRKKKGRAEIHTGNKRSVGVSVTHPHNNKEAQVGRRCLPGEFLNNCVGVYCNGWAPNKKRGLEKKRNKSRLVLNRTKFEIRDVEVSVERTPLLSEKDKRSPC